MVSISIDGAILARGGAAGTASSFSAASGSGGAIRLVAPVITGAGTLNALGGDGFSCQDGGQGRIRLEALEHLFTGTSSGDSRGVTLLPNPVIVTTVPLPQLRVVSIGGVAVPPNPLGNLDPVDVTIDTAQQVNVDLEAQHIPPGTTITVTIYNETDGTSTATSSPLTGTEASSAATASILILAGYSRVFTNAQWGP